MARATNLAGLESRVVVPCVGGPVETDSRRHKRMQATDWWQNPTFLALARTSVRPAEHSDVSLRVVRTKLAGCLALELLVEIAQIIAAEAAELALVGLEVT
jgi:hypothetical protein